MIRLEYFLGSKDVLVESDTNEITLLRVLDEIVLRHGPTRLRFYLVSSWLADSDEDERDHQVTYEVTPPGVTEGQRFTQNFTVQRRRMRAVSSWANVPLDQPGELTLKVLLDGKHAATKTVTVLPNDDVS